MPAQITGNNTSAIVTSVKLRVGVSTVIPVVGATRVYPVVDVAYILLVASAYSLTVFSKKLLLLSKLISSIKSNGFAAL